MSLGELVAVVILWKIRIIHSSSSDGMDEWIKLGKKSGQFVTVIILFLSFSNISSSFSCIGLIHQPLFCLIFA